MCFPGYTIPKGTWVIPGLRYIMRDPDYWKDPEEFNPERFLETDKDGQIQGYAFNGDPFEVFEYFFGTLNPDVVALDETGKQVKLLEKIESDW